MKIWRVEFCQATSKGQPTLVLVDTIQSFFFSSILLSAQQKSSIDDKGKHINMNTIL